MINGPPSVTRPSFLRGPRLTGMTSARRAATMVTMDTLSTDWVTIAAYENLGRLHPMAAVRA